MRRTYKFPFNQQGTPVPNNHSFLNLIDNAKVSFMPRTQIQFSRMSEISFLISNIKFYLINYLYSKLRIVFNTSMFLSSASCFKCDDIMSTSSWAGDSPDCNQFTIIFFNSSRFRLLKIEATGSGSSTKFSF